MEIREMTISDFEKIKDTLQSDFDEFWNANILKSELESENSKYIVLEENDIILGFAGILITPDDTQITNIVTKKSERNKGIGSLLLDRLIKMSEEFNRDNISLEVNEVNTPAISLYKKKGFEIVGRRKKYYNGINDAIIMTKFFKR